MATFILGTMPLFFGIGFINSIMGETYKARFLKLAAVAIIYLGISSINGSLIALGSPISLNSITDNFQVVLNTDESSPEQNQNDVTSQNTEINITSHGYAPNYFRVKNNQPVTLTLKTQDVFSCASAFRIPSLGISQNLGPNDSRTITFTPTQKGKIQFNCSMGMYTGIMEVI
jgi:uncharacterized protein